MRIKYKMADYDFEYEEMVKEKKLDERRKRGKLKPAMQRHNQKQMKIWATKIPRKNRD